MLVFLFALRSQEAGTECRENFAPAAGTKMPDPLRNTIENISPLDPGTPILNMPPLRQSGGQASWGHG